MASKRLIQSTCPYCNSYNSKVLLVSFGGQTSHIMQCIADDGCNQEYVVRVNVDVETSVKRIEGEQDD